MFVLVCVERCVLTVARHSLELCWHILEELMKGLKEGFASWCGGFMIRRIEYQMTKYGDSMPPMSITAKFKADKDVETMDCNF